MQDNGNQKTTINQESIDIDLGKILDLLMQSKLIISIVIVFTISYINYSLSQKIFDKAFFSMNHLTKIFLIPLIPFK